MLRRLVLLLVLLFTLLPAAEATWSAQGTREPDTKADVASGWMYTSPDTNPSQSVKKAYFNGFPGQELGPGAGTALDPNAAALGTSHQTYPQRVWAMLGVWKDCNKDGYVGLGEQAMIQYRSELLLDSSVCPRGSVPPVPFSPWMPVHNDGSWIHEFIPFSWTHRNLDGSFQDTDRFDIDVADARVWADDGQPGQAPAETSCYAFAPRGTYHNIGGIIDFMDCYAADHVASEAQWVVGDSPELGAAWETLRGVANPWGEPGDAPIVGVWDCQAPIYSTYAPARVSIYAPTARVNTASQSPAGTVNAALSGFDYCNRATRDDGQVHPQSTAANAPYALESDYTMDQDVARHQTDFALVYDEPVQEHDTLDEALGVGYHPNPAAGITDAGPFWHSQNVRALSRNPIASRARLGPEGVRYTTYYAWLPPSLLSTYDISLPKGAATGYYGWEACAGDTLRIVNGWDCDATHWYPNQTIPRAHELGGRPELPEDGVPIGPVPGDFWNLRDTDCADESASLLRADDISWGTLSGTRCV